ncbi:hypothetical protein IV102_23850 [bacterium]|nr:hypothetical protein [bacterium]
MAGEFVADVAGLTVGGATGLSLGAAAAALAVAGLGLASAPVAAGIIVAGMGVGAVAGAVGGAALADKLSQKMGQWGGQLAERLGGSQSTGEAIGRGALALGITAPILLTLTTGAVISGAPIAGGLMLVSGVANKAVGWFRDMLTHYRK